MKQRNCAIWLVILLSIAIPELVFAELVHTSGNYTTAGTIDGDLIVTNGSIIIAAGNLQVNGDIKVNGGYVSLTNGDLSVGGDLIVTNTKPNGDAYINLSNGKLNVTGAVITRSRDGSAYVAASTTILSADIKAGRISTSAKNGAFVSGYQGIDVVGAITTYSAMADAFVYSFYASYAVNIKAGSIVTYAPYGTGYVECDYGNIIVTGPIITRANQDATVYAPGTNTGGGVVQAGSITTKATGQDGYLYPVTAKVRGDIRLNAFYSSGDASIETSYNSIDVDCSIFAKNIYLRAPYAPIYIEGNGSGPRVVGSLNVEGDMVTREILNTSGENWIEVDNGSIKAKNIYANGILGSDSSLYLYPYSSGVVSDINVLGDIVLTSSGSYADIDQYGDVGLGIIPNMRAANIFQRGTGANITFGNGDAGLVGPIDVRNVIDLRSQGNTNSGIKARRLRAGKLFCSNPLGTFLNVDTSDYDITVTGPIVVKGNPFGSATVLGAATGLSAGSIYVLGSPGGTSCYGESIEVREDICVTNSSNAAIYSTGKVLARAITTDTQITSASSTSTFRLSLDNNINPIILSGYGCDFDLLHDYELTVTLQLAPNTTYTIRGEGHVLNFGPTGKIYLGNNSKLYLSNIELRNITQGSIQFGNNNNVIVVDNVKWSQADNYNFSRGKFQALGDFHIAGPGKAFIYSTALTSTIFSNAMLSFDQTMTVSYNSINPVGLAMIDNTSRISFDSNKLQAVKDVRFMSGTLVFDNTVSFSAEVTKTIYFGNGISSANNVDVELHGATRFTFTGNLVYQNV